jgi:hypothetical protein
MLDIRTNTQKPMNRESNPIALFVNPGTFAAQLGSLQSPAVQETIKQAMSNYGQNGMLIPQPPRRPNREQRIQISFFFTSAWDVTVQKL